MAANIKFKRTSTTTLPTGLTFAEPAFVLGSAGTTTANQLYIGDNSGGRVWIGAKIENTVTGWTATEASTLLATQQAIDARITSRISTSGGFTFAATSGTPQTLTPGDTITIAAGSGISTTAGATDTVTIANTGVLSFNGSAGAVTGVGSFNGLTGTVTGVASFNGLTGNVTGVTTGVANTFGPLQTFTTGICAAGFTFTGTDMYLSTGVVLNGAGFGAIPFSAKISLAGSDLDLSDTSTIGLTAATINLNANTINFGNATINGNDIVNSIGPQGGPGITGDVSIGVGVLGGVSITNTGKIIQINNTGVRSFNGLTGAVTGVSSVIAGTGISISPAGGTGNQTITNIGVTGLTGTANQITVSGTSGSITLSLPSAITTPGSLTVTGDLTVNGTTTTVNSTVVQVQDPIIAIGGYTGGAVPTAGDVKDRGIAFQWNTGTTGATGFFGHDTSANAFTYIPSGATLTSEVVSGTPGKAIFGTVDIYSATGNATLSYSGSASTFTLPNHASGTLLAPSTLGTANYILKSNGVASQPSWQDPTASGFTAYAATNVTTTEQSTGTFYLTFTTGAASAAALSVDATATTALSYNVATGTLTATAVDALIDGGAY